MSDFALWGSVLGPWLHHTVLELGHLQKIGSEMFVGCFCNIVVTLPMRPIYIVGDVDSMLHPIKTAVGKYSGPIITSESLIRQLLHPVTLVGHLGARGLSTKFVSSDSLVGCRGC